MVVGEATETEEKWEEGELGDEPVRRSSSGFCTRGSTMLARRGSTMLARRGSTRLALPVEASDARIDEACDGLGGATEEGGGVAMARDMPWMRF